MQIPSLCPVCGLNDLKQTPKKIICNKCGWMMWKNGKIVHPHNHNKKTNKFSANSKRHIKSHRINTPNISNDGLNSQNGYMVKINPDSYLSPKEKFLKKYPNLIYREVMHDE